MPTLVRRYDFAGPLLNVHRRESDGAVLAEGYAAKEGIYDYLNPDGSIRRELITRQAVLDTAAGIARAALTFHHPPEFVSPDNYQDVGVGDVDGETGVDEVEAQGGFARVKVAVRRRDAVDAFDGGVVELSPGYEVEIDPTPGVHPVFGRYDARQLHRVINHLALVPRGRGGHDVRLRSDSADAVQVRKDTSADSGSGSGAAPRNDGGQSPMPTRTTMNQLLLLAGLLGLDVRSDAKDEDLTAKIDGAVRKLKADAEEMEEEVEALKEDAATLKAFLADQGVADLPALKAKIDGLGTDVQTARGERDALQGKVDAHEAAAAKARDDAASKEIDELAKYVGVKVDGLDLAGKRLALAKSRVDSVGAETPTAYLDGIIGSIKADKARGASPGAAGRHLDGWDGGKADGNRGDGAGSDKGGDKRSPFFNPHLDAADNAFASAGASR